MGLEEFRIKFDNPDASYLPGQTVSGKVHLTIDSIKILRGIKLIQKCKNNLILNNHHCSFLLHAAIKVKITGTAYVHWSETVHSGNSTHTHNYKAEEKYFDTEICVLGAESGGWFRFFSLSLVPK